MKKMFAVIIATMIALTIVGCSAINDAAPVANSTTSATTSTDSEVSDFAPATTSNAPVDTDFAPATTSTDSEVSDFAHATTNTVTEVSDFAAQTTGTIGIATPATYTTISTQPQLVPSAKMLVAAYQEGNWSGQFTSEAGHCFSIDDTGCLWIDCEDFRVFPDLPNGENEFPNDVIGRNSEGTWLFHQDFKSDEFRFELWLRGELVAQSDLVDFVYDGVVSRENGITCRTYDGIEYTLTVVRDNLIVMSDANNIPAHNPAPKDSEKETTELIAKLQKLFWAGSWKGYFGLIDGHYVKIDENSRYTWNIDNVHYNVNLDVPVYGTDWSNYRDEWAIINDVAVWYFRGSVREIMPLPKDSAELVACSCCKAAAVICLDESGTLWHVDENETVKIAENIIDVYAINHNLIYLCQDGTAYLYEDGNTSVFAKNATEVGCYGDYGWGAVVPESEANLNYRGKHLWVVDNYLE